MDGWMDSVGMASVGMASVGMASVGMATWPAFQPAVPGLAPGAFMGLRVRKGDCPLAGTVPVGLIRGRHAT